MCCCVLNVMLKRNKLNSWLILGNSLVLFTESSWLLDLTKLMKLNCCFYYFNTVFLLVVNYNVTFQVELYVSSSGQKNSQRQWKSDCIFCLQHFQLKFSRIKDCYLFFFLCQESYVWKMYQERSWEFFPVGDCFRKQYEDQLGWM